MDNVHIFKLICGYIDLRDYIGAIDWLLIGCFVSHDNLEMVKFVSSLPLFQILDISIIAKSNKVFDHYVEHTTKMHEGEFYRVLLSAIEYNNFYAFSKLLKIDNAKSKILKLRKKQFLILERSRKCNDSFNKEFIKLMNTK